MVQLAISVGLGAAGKSEAGQHVQPPPPPVAPVQHLVLLGQSEPHRLFLSSHADVGNAATVVDENALELWWYDLDTSSPNNATGVQRDAITNSNKVSRWAVDMSNTLAAVAPGVQFKLCCLLFSGTGLDDLLDDGNAAGGRFWLRDAPYNGDKDCYDQFITDTGIAQPDAAFMSWQNTDSTQIQFQVGDAWWTALTGTGLDDGAPVTMGSTRHNVTYDHFLSDMWDTNTVPFTILMHRFDVFSGSDIDWGRFRDVRVSFDRMVASARNQARTIPFRRGIDPNGYENGYDAGDESHPAKTGDGATRYAAQLAYNMVHATGAAATVAPRIDAVTWTAQDATLASGAGNLTTLRILRGDTMPANQPKVAQLYFRSAEDPITLHEVPNAALTLSLGNIVINAAAMLSSISAGRSTFRRGDRIEFAAGPAGANDDQDKTDDTWLDYPGVADNGIELVPLQPVAGAIVCDLGTAPAVSNLLMDFGTWAQTKGLVDQGNDWFVAPLNVNFDSNKAGELNGAALTGGAESATLVIDVDREIGRDGHFSTQISLRDVQGVGHQRLRATGLWGEAAVDSPGGTVSSYGWMPLPMGRIRIWGHVDTTAGGRHILYFNNGNTGGAYGFAGLYNGQLSVADIAAL